MKLVLLACATILAAGACGDSDGSVGGNAGVTASTSEPAGSTVVGAGEGTIPTTSPTSSVWPATPPPVVFEPGTVKRNPFTVCWSEPEPVDPNEEYESYCADGAPEASPPIIEPVEGRIAFTFPVDGWDFSANYLGGRAITVEQVGDTSWELIVPADSPGGTVIVSGFGPQGGVHVAISLPGDGSSESASPCVEAIVALRQGLPTYDYESATDLIALIDRVDAVVVGTIDAVRSSDGRIELVLTDPVTWGGTEAVDRVQTEGTLLGAGSVEALVGVRVIAFVHRRDDGGFGVDVQGLLVECPGGINQVLEPLPDDPSRLEDLAGIDDLVSFVRQRKAPVGHVTTDIASVRLEQVDDFDVGETVPAQMWWTCGSGLVVPIDPDRYLPTNDVGGLAGQPGRPWQRTDFPAEWEVVVVNEAAVDGTDWVMLDAIAERLDLDTIQVRRVGTDAVVGVFVRDPTPPQERPVCG